MCIILLYGGDRELLSSRAKVLEMSGYVVRSSHALIDAEEALRNHPVELLVICHTVPIDIRDRLLDSLKTISPQTKALTLSTGHKTHQHPLHAGVDTSSGPGGLVAKVRQLCEKTL